jgi:hypothetical protein
MFKNGPLVFYVNGKKVWYCFPCFHIWQLLTSLTPSLHCIESWNKQLSLNRTKQTLETVNWTWAKLSWNCNSGLFNMSQWYICLNFLRMHFLYFIQFLLKLLITIFWKNYLLKRHLHSMIIFLYTIKKSDILAYFLSPRQRSCEGI